MNEWDVVIVCRSAASVPLTVPAAQDELCSLLREYNHNIQQLKTNVRVRPRRARLTRTRATDGRGHGEC